jgi:hypothetical protein
VEAGHLLISDCDITNPTSNAEDKWPRYIALS